MSDPFKRVSGIGLPAAGLEDEPASTRSVRTVPEQEADLSSDEPETEEGSVRTALILFVLLILSVKSAFACLLVTSSQLTHHTAAASTKWAFFGVNGIAYVTAFLSGLLGFLDKKYDRVFGVQQAVFVRVVGCSFLVVSCAVGLALLPSGPWQVGLGFIMCFCADAVVYSVMQFVAVVDPTYNSWVTMAIAMAYLVPMASVSGFGLDTSSEWTLSERLRLFTPTVVLTATCVAVFYIAWPRASPVISSTQRLVRESVPGVRRMSKALIEGLRNMDNTEAVEASDLGELAPSPYSLATFCGMLNAFGGMLLIPLIGLLPTSGDQAALIFERFWGEIGGQIISTFLVALGIIQARIPDLVVMLVLTLGRLLMLFYMLPLMRSRALQAGWMFWFRFVDTFVFSSTIVMAVLAAPQSKRRVVSRTDFFLRNAAGSIGLACCAAVIAASEAAPSALLEWSNLRWATSWVDARNGA